MAQEIPLTPEQEKLILDEFSKKKNPPEIGALVHLVFPDVPETTDGRSIYGRAIKKVLATKGLQAINACTYVKKDRIELTEDQREFIRNNYRMMGVVEMSKYLFNNSELSPLHMETRMVQEVVNELIKLHGDKEKEPGITDEYRPPKFLLGALGKIDKYVLGHGIDKNHITAQQKLNIESLLNYLNTYRFIHQINLYELQSDRDLFESSFTRYTYDKPDLTEEEVDQFIAVAHDNVFLSMTQRRIQHFNQLLENLTETDPQKVAKFTMEVMASITDLNEEYNTTAKRQKDLLGDLKQKRSARLEAQRSSNASILNLVQMWKEEESRKKLIHLADARKALLEQSLNEFNGMEEVKARLFGVDMNETLNG